LKDSREVDAVTITITGGQGILTIKATSKGHILHSGENLI